MMRNISLVAKREYLESVKTKTFIVMVALAPVMYGAMIAVTLLYQPKDKRFKLVDATGGQLAQVLNLALEERHRGIDADDGFFGRDPKFFLLKDADQVLDPERADFERRFASADMRLKAELNAAREDDLFAIVLITRDFLVDDAAAATGQALKYQSKNPAFRALPDFLAHTLSAVRAQFRQREALEDYTRKHPDDRKAFTVEQPALPDEAAGIPTPRESAREQDKLRFAVLDETGRMAGFAAAFEQIEASSRQSALLSAQERAQLLEKASAHRALSHQVEFALSVAAQSLRWQPASWRPPKVKGAASPLTLALQMQGVDAALLADRFPADRKYTPDQEPSFEDARAACFEALKKAEIDGFFAVRHGAFRIGADRPELAAGDFEGWRDREGQSPLPAGALAWYQRPEAGESEGLVRAFRDEVWRQRFLHTITVVSTPVTVTMQDEGGKEVTKGAQVAQMFMPYLFVMLMFMGIMMCAQLLLTNVVEEKSNRIIEMLIASVTPFELMFGKVLGLGAMGFTILALWAGGGYGVARALLPAEVVHQFVPGETVGFFLVLYILGFLLFASLLAAIGSACNTLKEAQNLQAPVSIAMVIPLILSLQIGEDPNATTAIVLTYVPPFTPFILMARQASAMPPAAWEIALALLLLCASVVATVWLAARIFRVGILMYGKPPKLRELARWIRY